MDNPVPTDQTPLGRPMRIADAARHLGVSERTVYRMLRAGKMKRVNMSDVTVMVSQDVSIVDEDVRENEIISTDLAVAVSDRVTNLLSDTFKQELERRDAEIERLLATQHALNETIQRLQDQVFELAKLVVTNSSKPDMPADKQMAPTSRSERQGGTSGLLPFRFFRRNES